MKRRNFCRSLAFGAAIAPLGAAAPRVYATPPAYEGDFLVTLQLEGGWDVTSFCDPKENVPGEPIINNWANSASPLRAGTLNYAPFANNASLFDKYYNDMLVINGVDAQTNSHTTGVLHNWSGKNSEGLPSITAIFAAQRAAEQPLAYINFGGFAATSRLIRYSRLDNASSLTQVLSANQHPWDSSTLLHNKDSVNHIALAREKAIERALMSQELSPRKRDNLTSYLESLSSRSALSRLSDVLPPEEQFVADEDLGGELGTSSLHRQMQLALLTFLSGTGSAADLFLGGFDTHGNHDALHETLFTHLADALDYFWTYADQLGIANRITLVIGSDFGRTPLYNADYGKDHWPIGSYIVMAKDAPWGNRVIGATDDGHNALAINPSTLKLDDKGTRIYPKHVHQALRSYLGVESFASNMGLGITNVEPLGLFDASKST